MNDKICSTCDDNPSHIWGGWFKIIWIRAWIRGTWIAGIIIIIIIIRGGWVRGAWIAVVGIVIIATTVGANRVANVNNGFLDSISPNQEDDHIDKPEQWNKSHETSRDWLISTLPEDEKTASNNLWTSNTSQKFDKSYLGHKNDKRNSTNVIPNGHCQDTASKWIAAATVSHIWSSMNAIYFIIHLHHGHLLLLCHTLVLLHTTTHINLNVVFIHVASLHASLHTHASLHAWLHLHAWLLHAWLHLHAWLLHHLYYFIYYKYRIIILFLF